MATTKSWTHTNPTIICKMSLSDDKKAKISLIKNNTSHFGYYFAVKMTDANGSTLKTIKVNGSDLDYKTYSYTTAAVDVSGTTRIDMYVCCGMEHCTNNVGNGSGDASTAPSTIPKWYKKKYINVPEKIIPPVTPTTEERYVKPEFSNEGMNLCTNTTSQLIVNPYWSRIYAHLDLYTNGAYSGKIKDIYGGFVVTVSTTSLTYSQMISGEGIIDSVDYVPEDDNYTSYATDSGTVNHVRFTGLDPYTLYYVAVWYYDEYLDDPTTGQYICVVERSYYTCPKPSITSCVPGTSRVKFSASMPAWDNPYGQTQHSVQLFKYTITTSPYIDSNTTWCPDSPSTGWDRGYDSLTDVYGCRDLGGWTWNSANLNSNTTYYLHIIAYTAYYVWGQSTSLHFDEESHSYVEFKTGYIGLDISWLTAKSTDKTATLSINYYGMVYRNGSAVKGSLSSNQVVIEYSYDASNWNFIRYGNESGYDTFEQVFNLAVHTAKTIYIRAREFKDVAGSYNYSDVQDGSTVRPTLSRITKSAVIASTVPVVKIGNNWYIATIYRTFSSSPDDNGWYIANPTIYDGTEWKSSTKAHYNTSTSKWEV